jgi:O-methyltransferase
VNMDAEELFEICHPYTMIERPRFIENVLLLKMLTSHSLPIGAVFEFGTWKGGMAAAIALLLGRDRPYHFFDSFAGLPPPSAKDGEDAHFWAEHKEHPRYFDNCKADLQECLNFLGRTLAGYKSVNVHKGWLSEVLVGFEVQGISFAHLDVDWYDSTYECLDFLWKRMQVGGVILIDDYYDWEGCRKAVHDFLAKHNCRESIRSCGVNGGVWIKKLGEWSINESPHLL